jgi:hypothetical protein
MERRIIWLIDLALWLVMRVVFVKVPFKEAFRKGAAIEKSPVKLNLPPNGEDLSVAISFAREFLDDQDQSSAVILEKFKAIMGMYSFSVPILIGFISPRMVLLPHWSLAIVGVIVCIPGFCMIKYFSVRTYVSPTISQEDISQPFKQQQIDQINWYYRKGTTINTTNNRNVDIYYTTYRWLGLALVTLLSMAFLLKAPPALQTSLVTNNIFNNFASIQEISKDARKGHVKSTTSAPISGDKTVGR